MRIGAQKTVSKGVVIHLNAAPVMIETLTYLLTGAEAPEFSYLPWAAKVAGSGEAFHGFVDGD